MVTLWYLNPTLPHGAGHKDGAFYIDACIVEWQLKIDLFSESEEMYSVQYMYGSHHSLPCQPERLAGMFHVGSGSKDLNLSYRAYIGL